VAFLGDANYVESVRLGFDLPLEMDGFMVIMQAARNLPKAIEEVLKRNR
jgi:hypothetical protein